jgi:hypothetical protein
MIRYRLSRAILAESRALLAEPGREGLEAVVLWLGREADADLVEILTVYMPEQLAVRTAAGVAVTLPDRAVSRLIASLPAGVFVAVRLHTHSRAPYHSTTDDENMLLSHRGAISIVVPDFAREVIDLPRCSVNELDAGFRWRQLDPREVGERFLVE